MGRFLPVFGCAALLALTLACNKSDQAKAKQDVRELRHNINQAVNSGSPATSGTTQSAEEKLRKGQEDLRVAGEKAGRKLDRATLIAKVKTKLATDVGLSSATSINVGANVDARGTVVILKGTVSSQEQKHQAEESVRQLDGVTKVVNDIAVTP